MALKKVYVDNGATSFPKAPGVSDAMKYFLDEVGCNVNRGGYSSSFNVALEVLNTRKLVCELFNFDKPGNVVFTPSLTYSINMILRGFLEAGDHVITSSMEHNAVMRPLHELSDRGVSYSMAQCDNDGTLDVERVAELITDKTRAMVFLHASNVCGTVLPIEAIGRLCQERGIKLIVDSAQTAGILNLDMAYVDALAFTAHKGMLGPQGLGGFILNDEMVEMIDPIITGGTGSRSHEIAQPMVMPDKFESGTMNIPAIMGLKASLEYIQSVGVEAIFKKEMRLAEKFITEVEKIDGVDVIGKRDKVDRVASVSLDFVGLDNAEVAATLDDCYGIMTRCGLHCAPSAHKTLGTFPRGTVRFSFGHFNTEDEVIYIVDSIIDLLSNGDENEF